AFRLPSHAHSCVAHSLIIREKAGNLTGAAMVTKGSHADFTRCVTPNLGRSDHLPAIGGPPLNRQIDRGRFAGV
ncbi:MAG: hypothetical protein WCI87_09820, partial [Euryarchaeota archaeon]